MRMLKVIDGVAIYEGNLADAYELAFKEEKSNSKECCSLGYIGFGGLQGIKLDRIRAMSKFDVSNHQILNRRLFRGNFNYSFEWLSDKTDFEKVLERMLGQIKGSKRLGIVISQKAIPEHF